MKKFNVKVLIAAVVFAAGCSQSSTAQAPFIGETDSRAKQRAEREAYLVAHTPGGKVYEIKHETGKCFIYENTYNSAGAGISCL